MFSCDITKARSFACNFIAVNYCLFAHSDVSYSFNGESNNVLLEFVIIKR